jgi:hypothetical protein
MKSFGFAADGRAAFREFYLASACLEEMADDSPGSPPDPRLVSLLDAARSVASTVLSAADPVDLKEALDEAFSGQDFRRCRSMNMERANACLSASRITGSKLQEGRVRFLGRQTAEKLARAENMMFRIGARLMVSRQDQRQPTEDVSPTDPVELVKDSRFPLPTRRLLLEMWHGTVAWLALDMAVLDGKTPAEWLSTALADHVLAGISGAIEMLNTTREQLDDLLAEQSETEAWIGQQCQRGADSGEDVFWISGPPKD